MHYLFADVSVLNLISVSPVTCQRCLEVILAFSFCDSWILFLHTGTTIAILNLYGTQPLAKDELYRYTTDSIITAAPFLLA